MMSTLTMQRSNLWEVTSRTIVYSAIGAALYGLLLVAQIPIPGSTVTVRPAFALVPFFGYAFGPIVGFFTGLVGNAIGDQISGWGLLTSWNWSIANGLVGLIAGLAPMYLGRWTGGSIRGRALRRAVRGGAPPPLRLPLSFPPPVPPRRQHGRAGPNPLRRSH